MDFLFEMERLGDKLEICVTPDHKFGTDAFLLSDFANIRRKDKAVDLGTGCGIIPLLWFRTEDGPTLAYGVDIQPKAIRQLTYTISHSSLEGRVIPLCCDLKEIEKHLPLGEFDVVTCNPPYKAAKTGILSELTSEQIARHEIMCTIEDVCRAAGKLLKFGGRLCVCQRPERLLDVLEAMRKAKIEPKRVRFVQQREGTAPWLFLAEGKKGSKAYMKVEKPLIVEGEKGFSDELLRIYQKPQPEEQG